MPGAMRRVERCGGTPPVSEQRTLRKTGALNYGVPPSGVVTDVSVLPLLLCQVWIPYNSGCPGWRGGDHGAEMGASRRAPQPIPGYPAGGWSSSGISTTIVCVTQEVFYRGQPMNSLPIFTTKWAVPILKPLSTLYAVIAILLLIPAINLVA